jgi:hypothetical protein
LRRRWRGLQPISGVWIQKRIPTAALMGLRSSKLQYELVDIAPAPILSGLERGHDRMPSRPEMLGGVPVLRSVATPDVPAGRHRRRCTESKALLAAAGVRRWPSL